MITRGWGSGVRTAARWIYSSFGNIISLTLVLTLIIAVTDQAGVLAATSCTGSVDLHNVTPASSNDFTISVENTGTTDIAWVDITVPSANFTYVGNSVSGWNTADHGDGTTLDGSTITPGDTGTFLISATTGVVPANSADWHISITSDTNPGVNPVTCTGDFGTAISGHPPNDSENGVSSVAVSQITSSSATIVWSTDSPTTSLVYYGATSDYGSLSALRTDLVTDHVVSLSNLNAASAYHFQVAGGDGQGGFAYSSDNTFMTQTPPSTPSGNSSLPAPTSSTNASGANTGVRQRTSSSNTADKVPPQITVTTNLAGPRKAAPVIAGTARDDTAVARVEYSTDGGVNWLPVDTLTGAGQKQATFLFAPMLHEDGNYTIMARAIDTSGNITNATAQTLIIDSLPPIVGGSIINAGPQIIQPGPDGSMRVAQGIDQKITLSAVGGPTEVTLEASMTQKDKTGHKSYTQHFSLAQSSDTGLWSGVVSFSRAGTYDVNVHARDGANNVTDRSLGRVYVAGLGHTVSSATTKPVASTVTVYYREAESGSWVPWDAAAFGQQNPQKTKADGSFSFCLPAGAYYVEARAQGYHTVVSSILTLTQPTPLTTSLQMHPIRGLRIGSHYLTLPKLGVQQLSIASDQSTLADRDSLTGKVAPDFSLTDTDGHTVRAVDLLGRPTLISVNSLWSPTSAEQMTALSSLQSNPDIHIMPVALQDTLGRTQAYTAIAGINLRWLADPNGTFGVSYGVRSLPTQYFLNRKGEVGKVMTGVLTQKQIQDELSKL